MTDDTRASTRSIELKTIVDATPEVVWSILTDPSEIVRWFPLHAKVEPGLGGSIWLSWGQGVEGKAPIHAWQPGQRFGWTENYGTDESGKAVEVTVDFHVETDDGKTVVRLVQSGLSPDADWDEMYDALVDGWSYFLFNLAFYVARHLGKPRRMVSRRIALDLAREEAWERLLGGALAAVAGLTPGEAFDLHLGGGHVGEVVSARPGYHFAGALPSLEQSLLFVEFEGKHTGIWLSTYGEDAALQGRLQDELDGLVERLVGEA